MGRKSRRKNKKSKRKTKQPKKPMVAAAPMAGLNLVDLLLGPDEPQRWINKWTVEEDLEAGPWFKDDDNGDTIASHDAARAVLARAGDEAGEVWLWCLHCQRFFQAKHLKLDFLGNWQRCPFDDCGAAGLDVDILTWDAYKDEDPDWPSSQEELHYGLCTRVAWCLENKLLN